MKIKQVYFVTTGLLLLFGLWLSGCGQNRELTRLSADGVDSGSQLTPAFEEELSPPADSDAKSSVQLTALADSQEAAQEIADLYGITLKDYSYGVATYTTDKNLRDLLDLGLENDYPELTPDYENQLYTTQESEINEREN